MQSVLLPVYERIAPYTQSASHLLLIAPRNHAGDLLGSVKNVAVQNQPKRPHQKYLCGLSSLGIKADIRNPLRYLLTTSTISKFALLIIEVK